MNANERNCISGGDISQVEMQISRSPFIATVNAVTSRQDLRWIIEPVMPSEALEQTSEATPAHRASFKRNTQLTADEEEKIRRRRERNKMAAAKCRNRKRELIDLLQEETERLHMEQVALQRQVSCLQQEKAQLKMLLASHASVCTLARDRPHSLDTFTAGEPPPAKLSMTIKQEPLDDVSGSGHLVLQQTENVSQLHSTQ
ncbi:fos-related antigen 2 isoform X2 [Puntigrus tetrazona]|uniref:fos-related antigen 2 isoform X2 n=1 Tax=Puntigrus tetrazona TaxID=1606681 RepID=UPI001C8A7288|nr:fos-related antigen 2 isoform X2 [Puntigrus tetrazona]